MRVAVIGGGPSGLVTLKYLIKAHLSLSCDPIEAWLFESEDTIGGAFAHRAYEDAELVSSKQLTTFSDFRCPRNEDFLSAVDYVRYLQDYCSKFQLWGNIKLESTIQGIKGSRAQGYVIEYVNKSGEVLSWKCDAIAVCSGLHREPNMPVIPGLNHVPQVLHSADFKTKNVSRANLFDTTYVHRTLRNSMILWEYYNYYIKALLWICSGTTAGMDQWIGAISPARHHPSKIFFNKSMKICPYLSLPYRPKQPDFRLWLYSLRSAFVQTPVPDTDGRQADLAPLPKRIDEDGTVEFVDNGRPEYARLRHRRIKPDMIIFCTGYRQTFPFLAGTDVNHTDHPSSYVRGIWKRENPNIGFIGFVRPSLGAIPPLSEMQAQLWVLNLVAPY
ncbi:unnamed protein product, partial [Fusarium langsethiae]